MVKDVVLSVEDRTENHARLILSPRPGTNIVQIKGIVRGPYSKFSKTLTADFQLRSIRDPHRIEVLIVEPCYWTPQLPFSYDLRLELTSEDRSEKQEVLPIGLKRYFCDGPNLRLESKRIVLRGCRVEIPDPDELRHAREAETTLLLDLPSGEICADASRLGVALIADLRGVPSSDLVTTISELQWYPAVVSVLISDEQLKSAPETLSTRWQTLIACCAIQNAEVPTNQCDLIVVELLPGVRPPLWVTQCNKPVIAIRKNQESEISTARHGCDLLQAELAPEFDLAGYFV